MERPETVFFLVTWRRRSTSMRSLRTLLKRSLTCAMTTFVPATCTRKQRRFAWSAAFVPM